MSGACAGRAWSLEPGERVGDSAGRPSGHHIPLQERAFHRRADGDGADVPSLWECRCGEFALREDAERPEPKATKPARTHWDMLMERRTTAELETLLEERLALLRSGRFNGRRSA